MAALAGLAGVKLEPALPAPDTDAATKAVTSTRSGRATKKLDYAAIDDGSAGYGEDPLKFRNRLASKRLTAPKYRTLEHGSELTRELLDETGFPEPILIKNVNGLGMKLPPKSFTVADVASVVGEATPVDVIRVATQSEVEGWSLGDWKSYFMNLRTRREILNVISLEFSQTPLARLVRSPAVARELDWIDTAWPIKFRQQDRYPHVQYYCLMSVKDSYTDFHIDFGGTSVWYHVLRGGKWFYFIPPTPKNLGIYEAWLSSPVQSETFLGDLVDECFKIEILPGQTMMIPTGWIHAVFTPEDSLVFGGNFLQGYHIGIQCEVQHIEARAHVPDKFRFPWFEQMQWFAAAKYLPLLRRPECIQAMRGLSSESAKPWDAATCRSLGLSSHEVKQLPKLMQWLHRDLVKFGETSLRVVMGASAELTVWQAAKEAATLVGCANPKALVEECERLLQNLTFLGDPADASDLAHLPWGTPAPRIPEWARPSSGAEESEEDTKSSAKVLLRRTAIEAVLDDDKDSDDNSDSDFEEDGFKTRPKPVFANKRARVEVSADAEDPLKLSFKVQAKPQAPPKPRAPAAPKAPKGSLMDRLRKMAARGRSKR